MVIEPVNVHTVSRRELLTGAVMGAVGLLLSACGGTSPAPPASGASGQAGGTAVQPAGGQAPASAANSAPAGAQAAARVAASPVAAASVPPLNPPVTVNLGLVGLAGEAGFYIAMDRGYFEGEGLAVRTTNLAGTAQIAQLANGQLDFGTGAPSAGLFNAIGRGLSLEIVAPSSLLVKGSKLGAFIMRQDYIDTGRYKGPSDLKGMTLAIQNRGNTNEMSLDIFLARGGLTQADVTVKELPFPDQFVAITNHAIDAAMSTDPFVKDAIDRKIAQPIFYSSDVWPGGVIQAVLLSPKFGQQQPEAAKRFVTAHLRGQRDYYFTMFKGQGSKEDVIQILNKHLPTKDPTLYRRVAPTPIEPNGDIPLPPLEQALDYFLKQGSQKDKIDLSRVVNISYMDYALARLGKVAA